MGIYHERGFEYLVTTPAGNIIKIVEMQQADERMLQTRYYICNSNSWFDFNKSQRKPLPSNIIQLTHEEKFKLINTLVANPGSRHGWYDTKYIVMSYIYSPEMTRLAISTHDDAAAGLYQK